jgi:hypothetical protein
VASYEMPSAPAAVTVKTFLVGWGLVMSATCPSVTDPWVRDRAAVDAYAVRLTLCVSR